MPTKRASQPSLPSLRVTREEATKGIKEQIVKGRRLGKRSVRSIDEMQRLQVAVHKWVTYNKEMLIRFFDSASISREFEVECLQELGRNPSWRDYSRAAKESVGYGTLFLETIIDRLRLIPESGISQPSQNAQRGGKDVFVVHGHDVAAKETVARFLEKLGLRAIILHEQPSLNRTIIEKLEGNANVGFAVVILTPDDLGYPLGRSDQAKTRARQNVIFELGFFIGRLGRARVCALYRGDVEIPSDYSGVLYLLLDDAGAWKIALAKEIREAGLKVDLNKAY